MSGMTMECGRAQELFSDHLEGTLDEPLLSELGAHLGACPECRELRQGLAEVVSALRDAPLLDPPADLAERAARTALAARRSWRQIAPPLPAWTQAVAAAVALLATLGVLATTGGGTQPFGRLRERSVNAGVYLLERKDRLVEDFRILRIVVGSAFDSRVDRLGDRLEDYRKLIERKKTPESEPKKTNFRIPEPGGPRIRNL